MSDKSIEQLLEAYQSHLLAKKHLKSVKERIERESRHLNIWNLKLKSRERQYKDLKKLSFASVVSHFLGNKESQIQSEREKYLETTLRYNECIKTLELLRFEEKILEEKIAKGRHLNERISAMITHRKEDIHQHFPNIREVLNKIDEKLDRRYALKQEVKEAYDLCSLIEHQLEHLNSILERVVNDNRWINSLGKGVPSDYWVNEMLDEAIDLAFKLKNQYEMLNSELKDLEEFKLEMHIKTQKDIQFFKEHFQGQMIADWILEQKLRSVKGSIHVMKMDIRPLLSALDFQLKESLQDILVFKEKRKLLILKNLK